MLILPSLAISVMATSAFIPVQFEICSVMGIGLEAEKQFVGIDSAMCHPPTFVIARGDITARPCSESPVFGALKAIRANQMDGGIMGDKVNPIESR